MAAAVERSGPRKAGPAYGVWRLPCAAAPRRRQSRPLESDGHSDSSAVDAAVAAGTEEPTPCSTTRAQKRASAARSHSSSRADARFARACSRAWTSARSFADVRDARQALPLNSLIRVQRLDSPMHALCKRFGQHQQ